MSFAYTIRGLKRHYGTKTALHLESLDIPKGQILGIFGPNGSGKSTLLRLLALLDKPTEGQLLFFGQATAAPPMALRRQICLMLQNPCLLSRSVLANVCYGQKVRGAVDTRKAFAAMQAVGLNPELFKTRRSHELSGGEAKRVALAARLAIEPAVLLLDEPTANIDAASTALIGKAVREAREKGVTVLIATHDMVWLEALADRIIHLAEGRLVRG